MSCRRFDTFGNRAACEKDAKCSLRKRLDTGRRRPLTPRAPDLVNLTGVVECLCLTSF